MVAAAVADTGGMPPRPELVRNAGDFIAGRNARAPVSGRGNEDDFSAKNSPAIARAS
jgi:hypothetical protein